MKLCGWCFDDEAKFCSCLAGNGPVIQVKTSAPRVVTDEDVERACKARFPETWGMMAENLKVIYRATSRRMLESFATSLPADVNDHETDPE